MNAANMFLQALGAGWLCRLIWRIIEGLDQSLLVILGTGREWNLANYLINWLVKDAFGHLATYGMIAEKSDVYSLNWTVGPKSV